MRQHPLRRLDTKETTHDHQSSHDGFRLGAGGIKLEATNPEQEQATEELDCQYTGPEVEIGFNVAYMLEALGAIEEDRCEVYLKDGTSAALVLPEGIYDARYVIMPMRL